MVSIIGLTSRGQAEATTKFLTDSIEKYGSADVADMLRGPIEGLATTGGAGPLLPSVCSAPSGLPQITWSPLAEP